MSLNTCLNTNSATTSLRPTGKKCRRNEGDEIELSHSKLVDLSDHGGQKKEWEYHTLN